MSQRRRCRRPPKKIVVISHRGEHLHHPENTMPAFQAAIDAGADYFELDVRTTSDGKFVIMHDNTLDRTTNGTGEVHKHTFDEIRALDAGAKFAPAFAGTKVPTLDEAFRPCARQDQRLRRHQIRRPAAVGRHHRAPTTCRTTS